MANVNPIDQARELLEAGATSAKAEGFLIYAHDFSTNEAKKTVKELKEELGIVAHSGSSDWGPTVEFLRANYGKMPKKELIKSMCEVNGKKYSSNQHAYNYIAMALEWAKQEKEA